MILNLYRSDHINESLNTLKYGMTLNDILLLQDYVTAFDMIEEADRKDAEPKK